MTQHPGEMDKYELSYLAFILHTIAVTPKKSMSVLIEKIPLNGSQEYMESIQIVKRLVSEDKVNLKEARSLARSKNETKRIIGKGLEYSLKTHGV